MTLAIIALVLCLLALLKVGIRLLYMEETFSVQISMGGLHFSIPERKTKGKKQSQEKVHSKPQKSEKKQEVTSEHANSTKKLWMKAAMERWQELLALIGRVLHLPVMDLLKLNIVVGNEDPVDCALQYGRIHAAVGVILPEIEKNFNLRKREIQITSDFQAEKIRCEVEVVITVQLYRVIALVFAALKELYILSQQVKIYKKAVQPV